MFPRRKRLSRSEFPLALKGGRRVSSEHFTVTISKDVKGYAVVVSKKTAPLSVTRHRIKRQVLSSLRSLSHLPPALIIFPHASVAEMKYQNIKEELASLLSKTS